MTHQPPAPDTSGTDYAKYSNLLLVLQQIHFGLDKMDYGSIEEAAIHYRNALVYLTVNQPRLLMHTHFQKVLDDLDPECPGFKRDKVELNYSLSNGLSLAIVNSL